MEEVKNTVKNNKVLLHPDKEDIIKKLLNGVSVKQVEAWLEKKYPKKPRLQISWVTLQKFRRENLNLHGEMLEDIKLIKQKMETDQNHENVKKAISKSAFYNDAINEIASSELDTTRRLLEMDKLINTRLIYYFNLLESGKGQIAHDKVFLEYIKEYRAILESWKKYIDGHADKKIEHNINISVVNEQVNVLKSVIFEILRELDSSLVPVFVDKLNAKLMGVVPGTDEYKRLTVIDVRDFDE